jgi:hypothetical protein
MKLISIGKSVCTLKRTDAFFNRRVVIMTISNTPKAWQQIETPLGLEITFSAKKARGFIPAVVFSGAIITCCGYLIKIFLVNWFIDKAGILPAGVIFFMLVLGGMYIGLRLLSVALRRNRYRFGGSTLEMVETRPGFAAKKDQSDKAAILKILCLKTPSKTAGIEDTWTTGITVKQGNGKSRDLFFEGTTKEESDFLSGILAQWTGVERTEENTMD